MGVGVPILYWPNIGVRSDAGAGDTGSKLRTIFGVLGVAVDTVIGPG